MLHHGVEDRQQLAYAGDQGHFLGFARGQQALVAGCEHRIMADCHQRGHIQRGTQGRPSAPDGAAPRMVPRSQLNGATPAKAAIRWRLSVPNSGSSSRSVRAETGPMPGTLRYKVSRSRQTGLARNVVSRSSSRVASWASSQARWASMVAWTRRGALSRRLCLAVRIATSWRRRVNKARSSSVCASAGDAAAGGPPRQRAPRLAHPT